MPILEYIAQALEISFGSLLVIKLLSLRLNNVYKLFSFFLIAEIFGSVSWLAQRLFFDGPSTVDYRLIWVAQRGVVCSLIVMTVYALLEAVLRSLPGILTLSRKFLNVTFVVATIIALASLGWESRRSGYLHHSDWQDNALFIGLLVDRVVSSVVLLSISSILCFLLWFPVQIPRNLAVFTVGFAIYSAGSAAGLLFQSLLLHDTSRLISTSIELLMSACVGFWAVSISEAGERSPAQLNLRRDPQEERRLLRNLELINDSLLRNTGR